MPTERTLRNERTELHNRSKPLLDKVAAGQSLTRDESSALRSMAAQISAISGEIKDAVEARQASAEAGWAMGGSPNSGSSSDDSAEARAFSAYLRTGAIAPELRAAGEASGTAGGYLVPQGWWQRLQVALKAYGGTASDFEQVETDDGRVMPWATTDPTDVVGVQIAENTQVADQDYVFGAGQLGAYLYTSGVQKVPFSLDQDSAFNLDKFVQARVGEALGRKEAADAISGSGSGQPLGIITALNAATTSGSGGVFATTSGVNVNLLGPGSGTATTGTIQAVEGSAAGTLAPDTFLRVIASVDRAYRLLGAKWYMNDTTLSRTRAIADGYGRPFYPELQDDTAPKLHGYSVVVDNNIPDLTAGTSSGIIFGHLESAMVARRVRGAGILRLTERYADFLQVGYIGWERVDFRSNDLRAAVVVKPAA